MVELLSLHQIRNYEDSNASNIFDPLKDFFKLSNICLLQLKTNICLGKPLLEKNGTSISDQCAVILIILMVLAAYPPRYPAQKVPEILLKSFTYKWPLLCILKKEIYILTGYCYFHFWAVLFEILFWTFTRPQTRKFVVLREFWIFGQCILSLEVGISGCPSS